MNEKKTPRRDTLCAQGPARHREALGSIVTPLYLTSTFEYESTEALREHQAGKSQAWHYTRYGNPTIRAAEDRLAALEGAEEALLFASGMGAVSAAVLGFVKAGDEIVSLREIYGGTHGLFTRFLPMMGVKTTFVSSLSDVPAAVTEKTRILYFETPTNPTLSIHSLDEAAALGKKLGLVTLLDGTFATPVNQTPLAHGVDVVIHSATKYLGGHSDLIAGAVAGRKDVLHPIEMNRRVLGACIDPHCAWLVERGMKTLSVRLARHNENALRVAEFLAGHPKAARVCYPGLPGHPGHDIARRQMRGFGGMVAFDVRGSAERVVDALRRFVLAVSLGGVESLVSQPVLTSHLNVPEAERAAAGISEATVRLSCGLEDAGDLIEDLARALEMA